MKCIKTGIYDKNKLVIPARGQVLFVDIWNKYSLYSDYEYFTFEEMINKYVEDKQQSKNNSFNSNHIKIIQKGGI